MLRIPCPHCGPRDETEFTYGGDATVAQPSDPESMSDAEWTGFLYLRDNPKGAHREWWYHAHGCRRWIDIVRDTASNRIVDATEVKP
ncbi:MAG: sarcosine oxidase subunit delta [Alphaproteobacteria bacterium]|nr:sarcosine oxidase subunit delta [Alphaproteobacteria bacterium]MDP7603400.1 sarcosine oxidase subunit delta [Alphaproteobacteria bacterium]HJP21182.1 sarcosine oxidase subunit delta [Alphaproteobacteria bacterium]